MYSVKQLAELASVSVRTLHYYDEIGLLRPMRSAHNGYRQYDDAALLRLQQILFYREIGLDLEQIQALLDCPDFDLSAALHSHREVLEARIERLHGLIDTIDETLRHLAGEIDMSKKKLFKGFSEEKQKDYEREIRLTYGPDKVNESVRRWAGYSKAEKQVILDKGGAIYKEIIEAIEKQRAPDDARVQVLMARWHDHIRFFYEPTNEILRGLGELYNTHPDFITNFRAMHPELGEYIRSAIDIYVDALEDAELAQLMADDEAKRGGSV